MSKILVICMLLFPVISIADQLVLVYDPYTQISTYHSLNDYDILNGVSVYDGS